jgi:hypothetical protein
VTSVLIVGWSYRWMQAIVLRGWWQQSSLRGQSTFDDFCNEFGLDAPVARPRWLQSERFRAALTRPTIDGRAPSLPRRFLRLVYLPLRSAWRNFAIGVQGLFCTYSVTGWGCLLMLFSWEFGWVNSFNKGYEQALVGPLTGFIGIFMFIAALIYLPMAQVHQAATGDYRAFFDFRFVWRLIQARPFAYVGVAAVIAVASLVLEILKTAPAFFDGFSDAWTNASDAEVLTMLRRYLLACSAVLFPALLLARYVAARVYRRAVLKVLREGWVAEGELHPVLAGWLQRLGLKPPLPKSSPRLPMAAGSIGGWWIAGAADVAILLLALAAMILTGPIGSLVVLGVWTLVWLMATPVILFRAGLRRYIGWYRRRLAFVLLFWIWFSVVVQLYVSEFFNYHPVVGFMNHVLVQFPCFDFIPSHLQSGQ